MTEALLPIHLCRRNRTDHHAALVNDTTHSSDEADFIVEPLNARDGVLNGIRDAKQRASVLIPFVPVKNSRIGELSAKFDIVLGYTPEA